MLPDGQTEMSGLIGRHLAEWTVGAWPEGLSICTVRRMDGTRVVFGHPDESTDLSLAIAASTAIPGYFSPVTIGGQQFLDGGLYSPTNADLLASEHLDLAIIISPMSGGDGALDRAIRTFARRRLRVEIEQLERAGTAVLVFEPGASTSRTMGLNPMAGERVGRVLQTSFFEAGAQAARPEVRRMLAPIAASRHRLDR
jgi:NTE family protein